MQYSTGWNQNEGMCDYTTMLPRKHDLFKVQRGIESNKCNIRRVGTRTKGCVTLQCYPGSTICKVQRRIESNKWHIRRVGTGTKGCVTLQLCYPGSTIWKVQRRIEPNKWHIRPVWTGTKGCATLHLECTDLGKPRHWKWQQRTKDFTNLVSSIYVL